MTPDPMPLVIAKWSDSCLSEMGDYLIEVAVQPDDRSARDRVRAVSGELVAHGHAQYTVPILNRLHCTACSFPPLCRRPDLSWEVHATAGSPVVRQAVVTAAEGRRPSAPARCRSAAPPA